MTKLKNTKKGMAKKALSVSLVAAMLATSNVPVWAAEDLFTDGSSAAVEAPVVEEPAAEVETFSAEPAEAVEEVTADAPALQADYTDDSTDVNVENYVVNNLKVNVGAWDTAATVSGSVTTAAGKDVTGFKYTWLADGVQAAGKGAVGTARGTVNTITYTPTRDDFDKTLSLRIYKEGEDGSTIFSKTITGIKVQPKVIVSSTKPDVRNTVYNGKEQKVVPTNAVAFKFSNYGIEANQITWSYTTEGNDFTNVTGKAITVVGTLEGTYDRGSSAYGYSFTSESATYQITKMPIGSSNMSIDLKKTSVPYTGKRHTFKVSDITVNVVMDDNSKVDITGAFKSNAVVSDTNNNEAVGNNYKLNVTLPSLEDILADTDEAKAILSNFKCEWWDDSINSTNSYAITVLNLNTCTGEITTEYTVDAFKENPHGSVYPNDIKITTADGESFTLDNIASDVNVAVNQVAVDAANAGRTGVIQNAVTVSYRTDTKNVSGSINLPITLTDKSLGNVAIAVNVGSTRYNLENSTYTKPAFAVNYNGLAYDLQTSSIFSNLNLYDGARPLVSGEYELSYDDNVNAGVVTVTITGKGTYEGSTKKVYFEINPHNVADGSLTVKDSVTINPNNNSDAALYKEALAAKIETELNNSNVTLKEGEDYTIKYYYADAASYKTESDIKAHKGTNNVGQYVYAVAKPVKDGNYTFQGSETGVLVDCARISEKSISNVTVTVEKDSYTFTGEEIIPEVTVKDGTITLEKGIDYIVRVKDNINVGTATITIVPTKNSDYDVYTSATATFTIEAANAEDVKVILGESSSADAVDGEENVFKYNRGRQIRPGVKKVELDGVDVTKYFEITYPSYGENTDAGKEAGSVTISPKATPANFTGTKTQLFDIKGTELTGALKAYYNDKTQVKVVNNIARNKANDATYSFYYDGVEQTFASEAFTADAGFDVSAGNDYEIQYINNINAGYGFVAVIAKGNYEGNKSIRNWDNYTDHYTLQDGKLVDTETQTTVATNIVDIIAFHINPVIFTARNITVNNGAYAGGMPVRPEVTVTVNGKTLVEGTDYDLVLRPIQGDLSPDRFTEVTTDKPYYVTVTPKGGYEFDSVNGTNTYVWGIDKKDIADCYVTVVKKDDALELTVMNGNVVETAEEFTVQDNGDGTATVSVVDGGKNYTGSTTVEINDTTEETFVGQPVIKEVKVSGNKISVVLDGEAEGATGYDYVISTVNDYQNGRLPNGINRNQLSTQTTYQYIDQGIYYAYCHAWTRDENGKKVFGEWSNIMPFSVSAITPEKPVITSVKKSGRNLTVTWTKSDNATGYDIVMGTEMRKVNGELRPVEYGKAVKKITNGNTVTVTFRSIPKGTYYVGLHAYNRTSETGVKVFSPWSNAKKVTF